MDRESFGTSSILQKVNLKMVGIEYFNFSCVDIGSIPHTFLVTKKKSGFTNHKTIVLSGTRDSELCNVKDENVESLLWELFIAQDPSFKDIELVRNGTIDPSCDNDKRIFFDDHGKSLTLANSTTLKKADATQLQELRLKFYHPYKSRTNLKAVLDQFDLPMFNGQILEATQKKVLVIDERLQKASEKFDEDQSNLKLREIFSFMGIDFPDLNLVDYLEYGGDEQTEKIITLIKQSTHHFVLLHLTILEKLAGNKDREFLANFLSGDASTIKEEKTFTKEGRAMVLMSGRGDPPNLPSSTYYVNFSTVYDSLIHKMSKPHLVQMLTSLRKSI